MHELTNALATTFAADPDDEPEPKRKENKKANSSTNDHFTLLLKFVPLLFTDMVTVKLEEKEEERRGVKLPDCKDLYIKTFARHLEYSTRRKPSKLNALGVI